MESNVLTAVFLAALMVSLLLKFWLSSRQLRHVAAHRDAVPVAFAAKVPLAAHQKAADYTIAKNQFGLLATAFGAAVVLGWTLLGGLHALNSVLLAHVLPALGPLAYQVSLIAAFTLVSAVLDLPFELYGTFRLEERFGFNRTTWSLYVVDALKSTGVFVVIGLPLYALVLWIMGATGSLWWLWAWAAMVPFILAAPVIYPAIIAPLYNKFVPLEDEAVKARVQALMARCGFRAKGFYVMDGSRRSAHSNAYFAGLGAAKRVVFYDTLLDRLSASELEAVLAHELGHFKHRHIAQQLALLIALAFVSFALLGWLSSQVWFYTGLGVIPSMLPGVPNDALALLLFMLVVPVFGLFISPLMGLLSRRNEFQADAYARTHASGNDLAAALLKLHEDNASTLTPDPLYVRFWYSHPPASERIAVLAPQTGSA